MIFFRLELKGLLLAGVINLGALTFLFLGPTALSVLSALHADGPCKLSIGPSFLVFLPASEAIAARCFISRRRCPQSPLRYLWEAVDLARARAKR